MTERELFFAALDKDDPTQWAAFLDQACAGDGALRQRVEALLRSHAAAEDFMDVPAVEQVAGSDGGGLDFLALPSKPGSLGRLGHHEVLEVVGRGGMGIVFRALDDKLQRVVAIKALAPQLASSSTARRRFSREARAAAAVTHDNVIDIHAVEDTGPVPYLVMQFIAGSSLRAKLERTGPLPLKETLRIGLQIAEGLAAAHRQGLVHRDVTPANILLENSVERVKLTDFGLARPIDDPGLTQSGVLAGTPTYMSPEQAQGEPVDFRSDLFSLGSVLYVMCTGLAPFRASTSLAVLKRVCEETPRSLLEINPELPRWLEDLVSRLHAKAPADRFASAREVADLLARRLAELQGGGTSPLPAEVPSAEARAQNTAVAPPARPGHPWLLGAAVLLVLLSGLGLSEATGVTNFRGAVIRLFSGEGTLVIDVDDPAVGVSVDGEELVVTGAGVREIRLKPGKHQVRAMKEGKLVRQELVTVTRDGRQVVRVSREPASAQLTDAEPPRPVELPASRSQGQWERSWTALRERTGRDGAAPWPGSKEWKPLPLPSPEELARKPCPADTLRREAIPAALLKKAGAGDPDHAPPELVAVLGTDRHQGQDKPPCQLFALAISPDGKTLASGGLDKIVRLWDLATGQARQDLTGHQRQSVDAVYTLAFSPDGTFLASGDREGTIKLWDAATGQERGTLTAPGGNLYQIAFSRDGKFLAAARQSGTVQLWEVPSGKLRSSLPGSQEAWCVAFSPDGQILASGENQWVHLWDVATGTMMGSLPEQWTTARWISFHPDGRSLVTAAMDRERDLAIRVWDLATLQEKQRLEGHTSTVLTGAARTDGRLLATGGCTDGTVRLWDMTVDPPRCKALRVISPDVPWLHAIAFSPEGRHLAVSNPDGTVYILRLAPPGVVFRVP